VSANIHDDLGIVALKEIKPSLRLAVRKTGKKPSLGKKKKGNPKAKATACQAEVRITY
jgi:hypothetical protein